MFGFIYILWEIIKNSCNEILLIDSENLEAWKIKQEIESYAELINLLKNEIFFLLKF